MTDLLLQGMLSNICIDSAHFDMDSEHSGVALQISEDGNTFSTLQKTLSTLIAHAKPWILPIWLLGSICVFAWSLVRVYRFNTLLRSKAYFGNEKLQAN